MDEDQNKQEQQEPLELSSMKAELALKNQELATLKEQLAALTVTEQVAEDDIEYKEQDNSLVEILRNPEITKGINTAVDAWANSRPAEMKLRFRALYLNIVLGVMVLIAIGALGYFGAISKDVTGTLVGSLIGYWYGQQRARQ